MRLGPTARRQSALRANIAMGRLYVWEGGGGALERRDDAGRWCANHGDETRAILCSSGGWRMEL